MNDVEDGDGVVSCFKRNKIALLVLKPESLSILTAAAAPASHRLSFYTTTEDLKKLFTPFGRITQARLILDPRTQRPKGFGFVRFESEIEAQNAVKAINGRFSPLKFSSTSSILSSPALSAKKKQCPGRIRASFIPESGMSMSQKLTLGYAVLVGAGGLMGSLKSGSQMSLLSGGMSASILFYIYTILPTNPVLASSLGLALAVALTAVMGSRFKKTGKIFPAGLVCLISFVMSCGYLHGVLHSLH
ncbi:OLC1v1007556C1 [Oldenlandia corymbosa var. corymbosa]|uniref:OLC1v1007556C1 n=1 Tax=Oldenlandia corymbosa var. corymbosa TaxID=529605 RepID=A0AAV1DLY7_OLDCO|nr:OLC1v1007556C1 [Oldenlandia corymbosa var. corymbosa]